MSAKPRFCKVCDSKFTPGPNHLGLIDVCLNCGGQDVPLSLAKVSYPSKHVTDALIEILPGYRRHEAEIFNALQRRGRVGPATSMFQQVRVEPWEPKAGKNYLPPEVSLDTKRNSGAEGGAIYHSNLGEKRTVK